MKAALLLAAALLFGSPGCATWSLVRGSPAAAPLGKVVLMAYGRMAPEGYQPALARACMVGLSRLHISSGQLQQPSVEDLASEDRVRWFEHYRVSTGADAFLVGDFVWTYRLVVDQQTLQKARRVRVLYSVALKLIAAGTGEVMASAFNDDVGEVDVEDLVAEGCEQLIRAGDPARAAMQQKGR